MPRRRVLSIALSVLALPIVTSGCSAEDSVNPVAQAATRTSEQDSARVVMTVSGEMGGVQVKVNGAGVIGFRDPVKGKLRMSTVADGEKVDMSMVMLENTMYMQLPKEVRQGGKEWMKIDLGKALDEQGIDLGAMGGGSGDPTQTLKFLRRAGDTDKLGSDTVGGVKTTHYRTVIDYEELAKDGPKDMRKAAALASRYLEDSKQTVHVWIDGENLVRRERMTMKLKPTGGAPGGEQTITTEYPEYGVDLSGIKAPDEDDVQDLTDLTSEALDKSP